ncbi:hypothetical protein BC937DRAFT_91436, partial [Endogone sp. FLAS-F59071]
ANAKTQDPTQVTRAPKITKEKAVVNFETMSAEKIERLHRAIGHQVNYTLQAFENFPQHSVCPLFTLHIANLQNVFFFAMRKIYIHFQYPLTTTYTLWQIKRSLKIKHRHISIQLLNISLPTSSPAHGVIPYPQPGTIFWDFDTKSMQVVCADGNLIGITHVKAEAKKAVRSHDFFNGYAVRSGQGRFGMFNNKEGVEPGVSGVQVEDYTKTIKKRLKKEAAKEARMARQRRRQEAWDKSKEKLSREDAMNGRNEWDRRDRRDEWGVWDRQDKWEEKKKDGDNDVAGWNGRDRWKEGTTTRWNRESGRDRRKEGATAEWDGMEGDRDGWRKAASTEWNSREDETIPVIGLFQLVLRIPNANHLPNRPTLSSPFRLPDHQSFDEFPTLAPPLRDRNVGHRVRFAGTQCPLGMFHQQGSGHGPAQGKGELASASL